MKIPLWLIALLLVGYTIWCANFWHSYQVRHCCGDDATLAAGAQSSGVPLFNWNMNKPVEDANFASWKKALLAKGGQGDTLVITGHYRSGEADGPKLALARAAAIRDMLAPEFPASRVRLAAAMINDGLLENGDPKESAAFSWSKMVLKKEDSAIIESDKDVILLFPFNSTEKEHDPKVDAYLKEMCEKHQSDATTFVVTGHTDDVGEAASNISFGLKRAQSVAKILKDNGITSSRIQTGSKGEAEPVADNSTEDGRHQNRRVVITVNR
jgi:OmpA-OmpF porin, OOP family